MPHLRKRHATIKFKLLSSASPLVGLLGHRQVGKTTFLQHNSNAYLSFDDKSTLQDASQHPKEFLSRVKTHATAIDECQLCPDLFPALKERVRLNKRPGQLFLSGSVRFTSKKTIRESLTGRIMNVELLPMLLSELDDGDLPDIAPCALGWKFFSQNQLSYHLKKERNRRLKLINQYSTHGGLPGVCFLRSDAIRKQRLLDQLDTIINRDFHQIYPTRISNSNLQEFISYLAKNDGTPLNHSEAYRAFSISPLSQKKITDALEGIFLIRTLPIRGDIKGPAIFFEDQAEVLTLSQGSLSEEVQWTGLVYRNLRGQFTYQTGFTGTFFQYCSRSGVRVPIAISDESGTLGIVTTIAAPGRKEIAVAQSFLKEYSNSKVIIVPKDGEPSVVNDRIAIIPATTLLF